jgi:hypothetical protein
MHGDHMTMWHDDGDSPSPPGMAPAQPAPAAPKP